MNGKRFFGTSLAVLVMLALLAGLALAEAPAAPLGTAFTYQGRLQSGGSAYDGTCDFKFALWNNGSGGSQLGTVQTLTNVAVTDGYFTVQLDFGSGQFTGEARWLEISVRCPAGSGTYTLLAPRQPLTPSPYALWAAGASWTGLSGVPAGFADGTDADTTYSAGTGLTLSDGQFSLAAGYRLPQACANGQMAEWSGSAWVCASAGWALTGNANTVPGTNFLGTSDNKALEVKVNGARALRLEPAASPNLVGGYSGNSVTAGVVGGTIGGGGASGWLQKVTDNYGTVAGGAYNQAGDGDGNLTDANYATAGGGWHNVASGASSAIGGGFENEASGELSAIAGGVGNDATGYAATVGGGLGNQATADFGTIAGGGRSTVTDAATENRVTDQYGTIGGGGFNRAGDGDGNQTTAPYATVGGGKQNTAGGTQSTVAGGAANTAGYRATVSGGLSNTASGQYSAVPGGYQNVAGGSYSYAAGQRAKANHDGAFVWADTTAADFSSQAQNQFAVRANGGVRFATDGEFRIENSAGQVAFAAENGIVTAFHPTLFHFVVFAREGSVEQVLGLFNLCVLSGLSADHYGGIYDEDLGNVSCDLSFDEIGGAYGLRQWSLSAFTDEDLRCEAICF